MKVLVCIPCLLTGGTEIQTLSLVSALVTAGHEVDTVCYFEHAPLMVANYEKTGSRVILLSPDGGRPDSVKAMASFLWRGLRKVVRDFRPDVAHVQYMAPGAIPIAILRAIGMKRIVATAHTAADIYPSLKQIHFLCRHVLTAFQCITLKAEKSFFGDARLFSSDTPFTKHGNHFTIYNALPSYITIRNEEKPRTDQLTIGVVSRLEGIKGMDLVVPAFARISERFPDARLLVVGDGTLRNQMEKDARERGIADRVEFTGRKAQSELQECYDRIDILLMPSRSEGFGLTAIEGMARGCVVVAADTGGLPEVVTPEAGRLHAVGDAHDIARKVVEVASNPDTLARLSAAAVSRAACFSQARYREAIASLYSLLCSRSCSR